MRFYHVRLQSFICVRAFVCVSVCVFLRIRPMLPSSCAFDSASRLLITNGRRLDLLFHIFQLRDVVTLQGTNAATNHPLWRELITGELRGVDPHGAVLL